MKFEGNVFIVTGGASGLGGATARMIVAQGGKVVIADVKADAGDAHAASLGAAAHFVKCDVTQEADGQAVVDAALAAGQAARPGQLRRHRHRPEDRRQGRPAPARRVPAR